MKHRGTLLLIVVLVAACGVSLPSADETSSTSTSTTTAVAAATSAPSDGGTAAASTTTSTGAPPTTLAASDPYVTVVGLGSLRVGLTVAEAAEAAGYALVGEPETDAACYHVTPDDPDLEGVSVLVVDGIVARIEIDPPSTITTRSGAGIGLGAAQLEAMFPGRLETVEYSADGTGGLAFVPVDEPDADYRVVFGITDGAVSSYRAGKLPAVLLTEGCS